MNQHRYPNRPQLHRLRLRLFPLCRLHHRLTLMKPRKVSCPQSTELLCAVGTKVTAEEAADTRTEDTRSERRLYIGKRAARELVASEWLCACEGDA